MRSFLIWNGNRKAKVLWKNTLCTKSSRRGGWVGWGVGVGRLKPAQPLPLNHHHYHHHHYHNHYDIIIIINSIITTFVLYLSSTFVQTWALTIQRDALVSILILKARKLGLVWLKAILAYFNSYAVLSYGGESSMPTGQSTSLSLIHLSVLPPA